MAVLAQIGVDTSYATHILPSLVLLGAGIGMVRPRRSRPPHGCAGARRGVASAMVNTTQQVGGSIGIALLSTFAISATTGFMTDHGPRPRRTGTPPSRATRPPSGGPQPCSRRARWSPARSCARTRAALPSTSGRSPSRRTRKGPTMQTTPPTPCQDSSQTTGEMLWEVADLAGGAAVMLLPLLLLAVPGIAAFVVLPALVLLAVVAAPVAVAGAVVVPTYLLIRAVSRRPRHRRRTGSPQPVGRAGRAGRACSCRRSRRVGRAGAGRRAGGRARAA